MFFHTVCEVCYRLGMVRLQLATAGKFIASNPVTAWAWLGCNPAARQIFSVFLLGYRLGMVRLQLAVSRIGGMHRVCYRLGMVRLQQRKWKGFSTTQPQLPLGHG